MVKKKPLEKLTPIERFLSRLQGITLALEILVEVLPQEDFLKLFQTLHVRNRDLYDLELKEAKQ